MIRVIDTNRGHHKYSVVERMLLLAYHTTRNACDDLSMATASSEFDAIDLSITVGFSATISPGPRPTPKMLRSSVEYAYVGWFIGY